MAHVAQIKTITDVTLILVLIILRLAASARNLVQMQRVNALAEKVWGATRLWMGCSCFTDVALLAGLGASSVLRISHLVGHVGTVA